MIISHFLYTISIKLQDTYKKHHTLSFDVHILVNTYLHVHDCVRGHARRGNSGREQRIADRSVLPCEYAATPPRLSAALLDVPVLHGKYRDPAKGHMFKGGKLENDSLACRIVDTFFGYVSRRLSSRSGVFCCTNIMGSE